jgi:hypothetical protein
MPPQPSLPLFFNKKVENLIQLHVTIHMYLYCLLPIEVGIPPTFHARLVSLFMGCQVLLQIPSNFLNNY